MEYIEAGKFLKNKRKEMGFNTQKKFIKALLEKDPDINCSESYISLIESGVKSPSVHLLNIMAQVLNLTPQEKGELLLIYKRVPSDLEFAVRNNIKESLKITNIDKLKEKYNKEKNQENFNKLIKALTLEGKTDEVLKLLETAPNFSSNITIYQERAAKIAAVSGNFDFAIQAFNLALDTCPSDFVNTKADILMSIGICYFNKALQLQDSNPKECFNLLVEAKNNLEKSLNLNPDDIYCIDEYARCLYHIADELDFILKNNLYDSKFEEYIKSKNIGFNKDIKSLINDLFQSCIKIYKNVISHPEQGILPEKAYKEAIYFYSYSFCRIKDEENASLMINIINSLDKNWLTYFFKVGYWIMKYELEKNDSYLDNAIDNLLISLEYDKDIVKNMIKTERNRELKILWELRKEELENILSLTPRHKF
ncbi:MAG: hypothetical protein KatS3mg068_1451 [Candidatus Sericytochromatia bacterium]|nr:MAG: hypothetical protein KatS3mg068_1451 [Candidatus Sericytochromatia bacterium]